MQTVAAYLLEQRTGLSRPEDRTAVVNGCTAELREWLANKGANAPEAVDGTYRPEDNSEGVFRWSSAKDGVRSWTFLRLDETTTEKTRHTVAISLTDTGTGVVVYVTIEAGLSVSTIKPVRLDPKCPRIVRALLDRLGPWHHGATRLYPKLQRFAGEEKGGQLADLIISTDRSVPILVVSDTPAGLALPALDKQLAYDLVGVANTYVIDPEAAWALTDRLGKPHSCFSGGVRIYWPWFSPHDDPYLHPLWTGNRLSAFGEDRDRTLDVYRRQIRQILMQAAALSVLQPPEIAAIQAADRARQVTALVEQAKDGADYEKLALDFAKENDGLRARVQQQIDQIRSLGEELDRTRAQLKSTEYAARYAYQPDPQIAPAGPDDAEPDPGPQPGEVRYYKKKFAAKTHDVLVPVQDCGCNKWQTAHKADKAEKGIEKLEGRNDWKSLQHCAKCTGGGM